MEVGDIRFYVERWGEVESVEQEALKNTTPASNWSRLKAIMRRANRLGVQRSDDDGEMEVFERWAILKARM